MGTTPHRAQPRWRMSVYAQRNYRYASGRDNQDILVNSHIIVTLWGRRPIGHKPHNHVDVCPYMLSGITDTRRDVTTRTFYRKFITVSLPFPLLQGLKAQRQRGRAYGRAYVAPTLLNEFALLAHKAEIIMAHAYTRSVEACRTCMIVSWLSCAQLILHTVNLFSNI